MGFEIYHSVSDIAGRLDVSPKTVKRWCEAGDLGLVWRVAGELRVAESGVLSFLDRHREDFSADARTARRAKVERMRPALRSPSAGIYARSEGELRRKATELAATRE